MLSHHLPLDPTDRKYPMPSNIWEDADSALFAYPLEADQTKEYLYWSQDSPDTY